MGLAFIDVKCVARNTKQEPTSAEVQQLQVISNGVIYNSFTNKELKKKKDVLSLKQYCRCCYVVLMNVNIIIVIFGLYSWAYQLCCLPSI